MADFTKPALGDAYTAFASGIRTNFTDQARLFDGATLTSTPTGAVRWNSSAKRFEKWSGSAWVELIVKASDKYDINVDRVDGYDAGNASGNIPVSNGTACANLNADMVDGLHASSLVQTSGTQSVGGVKTLTDGLIVQGSNGAYTAMQTTPSAG